MITETSRVDLREHAAEIVWAATRAPSYRDLQPWWFRVTAHEVAVHADLARSDPVADPVDRQLHLGLGAAVFGIRLALARLGVKPVVGLPADPGRPDLAAVVLSAGQAPTTRRDGDLYEELIRRPTAQAALRTEPVPAWEQQELAAAVSQERASAVLLGRAADRLMLAELARRTAEELSTVRASATIAPAVPTPPAVLMICTAADHRDDWLRAGQALHHALLRASQAGLAASFYQDLIEVPRLRARLRTDLSLPGLPQVLMGLGRPAGPLPPPTPRRPLADVLRP